MLTNCNIKRNSSNEHSENALECENHGEKSQTSEQLAAGVLENVEPFFVNVRGQLNELIGKQNKMYIDLSAEKHKLDNTETAKLFHMMNNIKIYREKLLSIKKQMHSIYQKSKVLKKRAEHIQACNQKQIERKLQKQMQEESLIKK